MMSPYNNLESGNLSSSSSISTKVSRRASPRITSSNNDEMGNGTTSPRISRQQRNGVIASPMIRRRRRSNQGSYNELFSLSILRLVLAILILVWFGVIIKLGSNLSTSSSTTTTTSSSSTNTADESPLMQKLREQINKSKMQNGNNLVKKMVNDQIKSTTASIFELSLLGNTSPKDFKLHTPNAPSCSDPIDADDISFTLVLQLSHDRIWMVPYHCKRWGDNPMSIVIFTDENSDIVKNQLVHEGCSREQLTVQTVSKTRYDPEETDYPVNVLRNLAFSHVKTTHLVYADVDFWPCESLHSILNIQSVKERMASDSKLATVIPVFQLNRRCREYKDCRDKNIPAMPKNKDELIALIKKRQASTFDPTNEGGHGSTRYISWKDQEEGTYLDLPCIRSNRYEPYLVLRYCNDLPPFQEGFSGYGKNKMTWAMQLRRSGYLFSQLGEAFLVHYPHLDSKSRLQWNKAPKQLRRVDSTRVGDVLEGKEGKNIDLFEYKRARVDALFLDYKDWLNDNVQDESRVPMCQNSLNDDIRLWVHREQTEEDESEDNDDASQQQENDDGSEDLNENLAAEGEEETK